MEAFDTFVLLWTLMLLIIICFNALAFHRLTKMREEE